MNVGTLLVNSVLMGVAGVIASVAVNQLFVRYSVRHPSSQLLVRVRTAANSLVNGKELDRFVSDYQNLFIALLKVLVNQCAVFLIFIVPMTACYFITARTTDFYLTDGKSVPFSSGVLREVAFTLGFAIGSVVLFIRRRF